MADFVLPALAEAFLVKEDPPLVLGGHWWMLPREQGFTSGCPVQHQSTKRHLGADAAQIRGRQSAPPAQIPAHSEGRGLSRNPLASAACCLRGHMSQTVRGPPNIPPRASTGLVWEGGPRM